MATSEETVVGTMSTVSIRKESCENPLACSSYLLLVFRASNAMAKHCSEKGSEKWPPKASQRSETGGT